MEQLIPTLAATSPVIASVAEVLVDSGFYSEAAVSAIESGPVEKDFLYKKTPQGELKLVVTLPPDARPGNKRAAIVFFSAERGLAATSISSKTWQPTSPVAAWSRCGRRNDRDRARHRERRCRQGARRALCLVKCGSVFWRLKFGPARRPCVHDPKRRRLRRAKRQTSNFKLQTPNRDTARFHKT